MKHFKLLSFVKVAFVAFFFACTPVMAQWQVPDHSVPIGRGAGTGFKSVGPGINNQALMGATGADPTFRLLVPSDIPITGLSANVASSGIQGIEGSSFFIFNSLAAANPAVSGMRSQYDVSYTTLHPGASYPALWGFTNIQAGVQDSFYGVLGNVYNHSTAGEQVGGYLQGWRYADGQTWAAVTEARDLTGSADPTKTLTAIEADIFANGTDANKQRIGVEVVIGKHNSGGAAAVATYGFRLVPFNNDTSQGSFTKGLSIEANVADAIDLHTISASHSALWMADGQKILFDTAGTRSLSYSSTVLSYAVSGSNIFNILDNGNISAAGRITANGGFAAVGSSSGTTNINASATAGGTLTLPNATDTLVGKATTDVFTNKTYDTAGTGNSFSINGVAVTANTGTGAVARAASPTFTGTVGAAAITATGLVTGAQFVPTSSSAPTNGMFLPAANTLGFAVNSAQNVWITADGVGIGAATVASVPLQITNASASQLRLLTNGGGNVDFRLNASDGGGGAAILGTYSNHQFAIFQNAIEVSRFTANGLTVLSQTAVPAGGSTGKGLSLSSATNLGVYFGSGAPTLSAAQGSIYIRTDGSSTSTRLYVNTNGTTGWTNFVSAT